MTKQPITPHTQVPPHHEGKVDRLNWLWQVASFADDHNCPPDVVEAFKATHQDERLHTGRELEGQLNDFWDGWEAAMKHLTEVASQ